MREQLTMGEKMMRIRAIEEITMGEEKREKRMRNQFGRRIEGFNLDTVEKVCRSLVKEFDLVKSGYVDQRRVDFIQTESEMALGEILGSWVKSGIKGVFGVGNEKRVNFMREWVKTEHENGVKNDMKEPIRATIKSDFIKSTGINLSVSTIGTDQYKAVAKVIKFAEAEESLYSPDSKLNPPGTDVLDNLPKLYKINSLLKENRKSHLKNKSKEYSDAFKATYGWLSGGFLFGGSESQRDKLWYLSGLVEKLEQVGNYNPIPLFPRWSAIKKV